MSRQVDIGFANLGQRSAAQRAGRGGGDKPSLEVNVISTTVQGTLAAMRRAEALARNLGTVIRLLVTQVVPYPLPLTQPAVPVEFTKGRFLTVAMACQEAAEVQLQLYLCRDRQRCLLQALKPGSLAVIGLRKTWSPTRDKRLARMLASKGHQVILVESK